MSYVPVHERVNPPEYPTYADNSMSDSEREGPSKKRRREEHTPETDGRHAEPTPPPGSGSHSRGDRAAPEPAPPAAPRSGISPSIFGIAPRNEVTRVVGDFIMRFGKGKPNLEIEVKLGTVCNPGREYSGADGRASAGVLQLL